MSGLDGIGVVGAGGGGRAVAAHLASRGLSVHLCTRDLAAVREIARRRELVASGVPDGRFPLRKVTADPAALAGRAVVLVATPMVDAAITIMSVLGGEDFRRTGRTLARLGWDGLGHDGIRRRLRAGDRVTGRAA